MAPATPYRRRHRRQPVQLEHVCAYCGRTKAERPPVWCVRAHEVWAAKQTALRAQVSR